MTLHDFTHLFEHYPEIIGDMPQIFKSHDFIIKLAQSYQVEYVEALYSYRGAAHLGTPAPFVNVHRELAKGLRRYPTLVEYVDEVESKDIFNQDNKCSRWRKL